MLRPQKKRSKRQSSNISHKQLFSVKNVNQPVNESMSVRRTEKKIHRIFQNWPKNGKLGKFEHHFIRIRTTNPATNRHKLVHCSSRFGLKRSQINRNVCSCERWWTIRAKENCRDYDRMSRCSRREKGRENWRKMFCYTQQFHKVRLATETRTQKKLNRSKRESFHFNLFCCNSIIHIHVDSFRNFVLVFHCSVCAHSVSLHSHELDTLVFSYRKMLAKQMRIWFHEIYLSSSPSFFRTSHTHRLRCRKQFRQKTKETSNGKWETI